MSANFGRNDLDGELVRARLLLVGMLLAFGGLAASLYYVQVAQRDKYQGDLEQQSVRRIRVPGMRGQIVDRLGNRLAENRPSYGIAVYLEELRLSNYRGTTVDHVMSLVGEISEALEKPPEIDSEDVQKHMVARRPLPLLLWRDLTERDLARFSERAALLPGVAIQTDVVRVYPEGSTAAHVIGYVGRTNMVHNAEMPYHYYAMEMIGRSGVEKEMDEVMRGREGGRLVRVDVAGYRFEDLARRESARGKDVELALDLNAQRIAEEAMADTRGAAVVIDPRNGDVLAMASSPSFDINRVVPFITHENWAAITNNPGHPLINRAATGTYAPGSIFKPIVAMAGLENGLITANETYTCPGYYLLGRRRFNCWLHRGHGDMDLRDAIQNSCNVYFFNIGRKMGHEYMVHMAAAVGLGTRTGIQLDVESPGLLPDEAWKRRTKNDAWRAGDTLNLSIGQGALLVTPLQMALAMGAFANGGLLYKPRLVRGTRECDEEEFTEVPPEIANRLNWSDRSLRLVRGAMFDTVMTPRGTGRKARVPGIEIAGKTGTAQWGPPALNKKRGWMIAFAPFHNPRYAVAVVVDEAQGGGIDAGPRVQRILAGLFGVPLETSAALAPEIAPRGGPPTDLTERELASRDGSNWEGAWGDG